LERRASRPLAFFEYYRTVAVVRPEIESLTGHRWTIPDTGLVERNFSEYDAGKVALTGMPGYDYIAHLRHYGFPSPLLDWTRSPFVAAHFAFAPKPLAEKVSIFAFCERPQNIKGGSSAEPQIIGLGPIVGTHKRHFLQQCEYTICVKYEHRWRFEPHGAVFDLRHPGQDLLWKFNLPATERQKVLSELSLYNLNAYSLFGSEESLMETLAAREWDELV
jgi:FRG domain-containing protein